MFIRIVWQSHWNDGTRAGFTSRYGAAGVRSTEMQSDPTTAAAAAGVAASAADRVAPARSGRGRRRPRWRKWLILALILVVLRLTLPALVAPWVALRLSHALGTRVEVGDLSFQPIDAILTLRNVTVHAPAQSDTAADESPPIEAKRVRIDFQ